MTIILKKIIIKTVKEDKANQTEETDMKNVMTRAWEIKREEDRKMRNRAMRKENRFELKECEKAVFAECLKMAWEEAKKAEKIAEKYNVSVENAQIIVAKENELLSDCHYGISWNIWSGYGHIRAYYKCEDMSKYANSKKTNFVELVA